MRRWGLVDSKLCWWDLRLCGMWMAKKKKISDMDSLNPCRILSDNVLNCLCLLL